jgi:hypothetical protein
LNSLPLSYIKQQHCGYLLNQVLHTRLLICAEGLSNVMSASLVFLFVTLLPLVSLWSFGSSTILNQLVAGSIIVRHIKSILEPSLPLRVYGPMRSTHNTSKEVVMTIWWYMSVLLTVSLIHLARSARFDI